MANFRFKGTLYGAQANTVVESVKSGTTASIAKGDLVTPDDGNAGYVKKGANGATATIAVRTYLAVSASTETSGADGTVTLVTAPNMVLEGTATTPGNIAQAVLNTKVTLDVSNGVQTVDENDTSTGFMRILRPDEGVGGYSTTTGIIRVAVNE